MFEDVTGNNISNRGHDRTAVTLRTHKNSNDVGSVGSVRNSERRDQRRELERIQRAFDDRAVRGLLHREQRPPRCRTDIVVMPRQHIEHEHVADGEHGETHHEHLFKIKK